MAELLPDAAFVTIEGAGHRVHQTRPGEFLDAVLAFLGRIGDSTRPARDQPGNPPLVDAQGPGTPLT
jgi:hypothetical protein